MENTLLEDIKYGTNIIPEEEYLDTIISIADTASEMVRKTLGPYGKTTIIDDGTFTYPTKDGWSVLKRLRFNDPIFNTLYNVLKQVSFDLVNKVGDGTTSAFIGATIFMHKIIEYRSNNEFRQSEFLDALNKVSEEIITALTESKYVKRIDIDGDFSDIYKIAMISSNGNKELSEMIQKIYQETLNPNIYVSLDPSKKLSYQIQTGYKLDCNPINQAGYRNAEDGTFVLNERSLVAIFDHNVTYNEHDKIIGGLSRYASAHRCTVFILAPHFDDIMMNIIGTSINSMLQQGQVPNIMLIQVPLSASYHRDYLSDVVLLTNAQVFDYGKVRAFNVLVHNQTAADEDKMEDALLNTDQYNFSTPEDIIDMCIGKMDKVVVDEKYFLIQDYKNIVNEKIYEAEMENVKRTYEEMKEKANKSTQILQKDYMNAYQHYIKLFGSMGTINVGGASELEKHCLKDAVDDAVLACRSAVDNGYIRGLNLATMNVINTLIADKYKEGSVEYKIADMLYDTFYQMSLQVLANKGTDKRLIRLQNSDELYVLENIDIIDKAVRNEWGYDLVKDKFMTDENCTVINSTLTDIEVLRGIISILSTMLTSNQFLSINRSYDRVVGKQQQLEEKMNTQKMMTSAAVEAAIDVITKKASDDVEFGSVLSKIKKFFKK